MFNFLFRKLKGYKKINLYFGSNKIEDFVKGIQTCNVYRYQHNPFRDTSGKECISLNDSIKIKGSRLMVNSLNLDLHAQYYNDVSFYLGKNLVIRLPRGYEGNFTYYIVEKVS